MSVERSIAFVILVLSAIILVRLGPAAVISWRIYSGVGRRRQQDAAGRAPAVPPSVAERIAILGDLGYQPLGQTRLVLPTGERFSWILAAADAESYAILTGGEIALTGLFSAWPDGTWLGTMHPRGQAVDRSAFQVRIVPTTLADAVGVQRTGLARLTPVHGAPRPIRTMADMLALDADYRTRFGGSRLRPKVVRIALPAFAAAIAAVLSLALVIMSPR